MARRAPRTSHLPLAAIAGLAWSLGCTATTEPPPRPTPEAAPPAPPAPPAAAAAAPPAVAGTEPAAKTPPPLSEEDLALIAADPKDLTPQMRRKRAYARRRQIMQNPDSPVARALSDLAEAHRAGELEAPGRDGLWLSLPGTTPKSGRPPAGWRPPEGEPTKSGPASPAPAAPAAAPAPTPSSP